MWLQCPAGCILSALLPQLKELVPVRYLEHVGHRHKDSGEERVGGGRRAGGEYSQNTRPKDEISRRKVKVKKKKDGFRKSNVNLTGVSEGRNSENAGDEILKE